jgi:hypothetical protein
MGEKFLNRLKKIAEAWKGILAVVGITGAIGAGAIFVDHWKADNAAKAKSDVEIKQTLNIQGGKVDSLLYYMHVMKLDVTELKRSDKILIRSLAAHLANDKSVTKDDLLKFIEQFQILNDKKKEQGFSPTVLRQNR